MSGKENIKFPSKINSVLCSLNNSIIPPLKVSNCKYFSFKAHVPEYNSGPDPAHKLRAHNCADIAKVYICETEVSCSMIYDLCSVLNRH